jgi:16S rRNA (cytidine1402-2'-O)-methyltransferase
VARAKRLATFAGTPATLIFFESPQRLAASLAAMVSVLGGGRQAAVARELTKAFETVRRDTLESLSARFAAEPPPKGEIVILVGPPEAAVPEEADVDALLSELLREHSVREAAAEAAARTGLPRRALYSRALELKGEDDGPA